MRIISKCFDLDLQNDLKNLMKEIEEGIHLVHQEAREKKPDPQSEQKHVVSNEKGDNPFRAKAPPSIISTPSRIFKHLLKNCRNIEIKGGTEAYSEPSQRSKMECFAKIVNG